MLDYNWILTHFVDFVEVLLEDRPARVVFPAYVARKRPRAGIGALMLHKVYLLTENFPAILAFHDVKETELISF